MKAFWASSSNKCQWQQIFCDHVKLGINSGKWPNAIYMGADGEISISVKNGNIEEASDLVSDLEEADECLFVHVKHALITSGVQRILLASSDTDAFVCSIYHYYKHFKTDGLIKLWVLCGKGSTTRAVPVHKLVEVLSDRVIHILPAVHALTGCDTTSKFSTKHSGLVQAKLEPDLLEVFGKQQMTEAQLLDAEIFLMHCLSPKFSSIDAL